MKHKRPEDVGMTMEEYAESLEEDSAEVRRENAERKALDSMARYKFWMFGYHAAQWVLLNRLLPPAERRKNPFKELVLKAREMREARKEAA